MIKALLTAITLSCICRLPAQEKLFLVFEFMRVDNEQELIYMETENFWKKIHEQRVKNGDIFGWDLWRLQPGGEDQGYQYLTVNLYDDKVKMMSGTGDVEKALKDAYPDLSEEELYEKFNQTGKSRDLAVRLYLERLAQTENTFEMPLGTVAAIDMMKAEPGKYWEYEKAEKEVFKPMHQRSVNNGSKGNWSFFRILVPSGSDNYASHITVNMFKDYNHMYNTDSPPGPELSADEQKAVRDGIDARDMKYTYMATLIRKVR